MLNLCKNTENFAKPIATEAEMCYNTPDFDKKGVESYE